jgi:hypothetical protein
LLLAVIAVDPSAHDAVSPPHGWVPLPRSDYYSSNNEPSQIFYKIAGATEPATYVFTTPARHRMSGGITDFSGVRSGRPIAASAARANPQSTRVTAPSITPHSSNMLLVFAGGSSERERWVAPQRMTEQYERSSKGSSVEVATESWPSQKTTGRRSARITREADTVGVLMAVAGARGETGASSVPHQGRANSVSTRPRASRVRGSSPSVAGASGSLATTNSPQAADGSPSATSSPQGNWVGTYGDSGYDLAAWNGGTDVVSMPGASVSLVQGSRWVWDSSSSDARDLESLDKSSRVAATYYDPSEIQVQLNFSSAYSGNLELYAVDQDSLGRRETITVGSQTATLNSDFSQGAWAIFPINVAAGSTLTIKVDNTGWPNAVLSGILLGAAGTPPPMVQTQPQGNWVGAYGASGYDLAAWNGGTDVVSMPGASVSLAQGGRWVWGQNNSDVRYLQSVDKSSRVAATYWDGNEVQVQLSFS